MASTYATQKTALTEIAGRIVQNRQRLARCQQEAVTAESDLGAMVTVYGSIVADIDADLAASPGDTALQVLKADKDKLVAEFVALAEDATTMKNATAGVQF